MGVLDGKVVIVTGGGRGIGRECALLAAKEGAKVLVNDLGGGTSGADGATDAGPAEQVAAEIRAAGGEAISNADSVADYKAVEAMVQQAIEQLGGLHAVINPAGILRDGMFHKMAEADWDSVIQVHLRGAFNVARASVEHFRNQADGAYVMFASTSGLIGNIAQTNYAAAKMGVAGLSRVLAIEGALKNVRSNVIAPYAWTRLVATIQPKDDAQAAHFKMMEETMRADQVAPLAIALAADAKTSGQLFISRGNEITLLSQPRPIRQVANTQGWSAAELIDKGLGAMRGDFYPPEHVNLFPYNPL
ncbi:MAG: 3-hydroxyacyl-CoA dehydrogenase [Brevundimonas sp.]|nr:3-hydroxyacyl-CoA dehydrogenase [Brevundimonas sp.]